ncbi:recombinase family protein [Streptomyces sp. NBC_00433]
MSGLQRVVIEVAARAQKTQLRAVDYLRVSTEEQVKGYGIPYSSKRTAKHIVHKGWEHVGTFADEGVSGSLLAHERDDLTRLMVRARQTPRPFDVVVVNEERAIGRAGRAFWPWVWELEDLGVFVAVVKGDYDNTTPDGRSRMRKAADRAQDERETIRDRTQGGIQEKAEDGRHPGGQARYGYHIADQGRVGQSRLALDICGGTERCTRTGPCQTLHETTVLRRGRHLVIQFHGNWGRAVLTLNAEGFVSRSGKPWSVANFRNRFLQSLDPRYVFRSAANATLDADGSPVWGESVTIDLDPVFTPEEVAEFRRAWNPKFRVRHVGRRTYPLTGRITSLCGSHYVGASPTTKDVSPHYVCAGKAALPGSEGCSCSQLDALGVEAWAWEAVSGLLGNADKLHVLAERQKARTSEERIDHASRLAELDQQVAEQQDAIDTIMVMGAKSAARRGQRGKEAETSVARMIKPLEDELEALEAQRREVVSWQADAVEAAQRTGDLQALAEMAAQGLQDVSAEDQRRLYGLLEITGCLTGPVPQMRKGLACSVAEWFRDAGRLVPDLTNASWAKVAPLMPRGEKDRPVLEAVLTKAASDARWEELYEKYGTTALRTYWRRWKASGLWEQIMAALPEEGRPVPRRHPLPPIHLHGVLQPGLILATASEDHGPASGPSGSACWTSGRPAP